MKVVVIGGGVAGLSIGWRMVQAGAEVTVLERAQPAQGATWAAAGMLAVAGELGGSSSPEAEFAQQARDLWPAFAAEIEAASGRAIGYEENGALIAALSNEDKTTLARWPEAARIDSAKAIEIVSMLTPGIAGAVWAPQDAKVDTRALGEALARAFVRAGGTLKTAEPVIRFELTQGKIQAVRTPFGFYEADAYVLAAGAWTAQIEGLPREAMPPVIPVKGEMIALAPPAGVALPKPVVWGNGVYLVPRGKRLLVGATMEEAGFDTSLTRAAAKDLQARAVALMPQLAQWDFADHWAGLRPGSPDGLPMLGPTTVDGLYAATGQFRNGILFAPAIAELLCRIVLKRQMEPLAFDPRRFR
jgi:glycine oxidase